MSSAPKPPVPIKDQCTTIHDNTLYVYTPDAFLSLDLKQNATWNTLPNGIAVKGAVCVKGTEQGGNSGDALWVVGGQANETNADYPGLQRFSFASKKWDTVTPLTTITKNRRNHGAAFLNDSGHIIVYAGSQQDPKTPSIETFLIQTFEPFNVLSASGNNNPVIGPVVLPWDSGSAIAFGGSDQDKNIYRFTFDKGNSQGSWKPYDTGLPTSLKSLSQQQATLAQGSDGSKVLELYDCGVSPNAVTRYVLLDNKGKAPPTGTQVGDTQSKRELSLAAWPDYNATAAPKFTRDGFSLSRSDAGVAAMTGGNEQNAVSLFNEADNTWIDSSHFFNVPDQQPLIPTSTPSPSPTASPTSSPTPSSTDSSSGSNNHKTTVILGAVLGTIFGLIVLCIIALVLFKYRQRKQKQQLAAQAEEEKRRMSFADRGDPFMMEGGEKGPAQGGSFPVVPLPQTPHHRHSSTRGSDSSTARLVPRKPVHAPEGETLEMDTIGEYGHGATGNRSRRSSSNYGATPKRSSGWSRYFSGNNSGGAAVGGAAAAAAVSRKSSNKSRGRYSEDAYSTYTTDSAQIVAPAELPPLKLGQQFTTDRVSRVVTGTPPTSPPGSSHRQTVGTHSLYSNRDSRPRTAGSAISAMSSSASAPHDSVYSRQPGTENQSSWTTFGKVEPVPKLRDGIPSSIYSRDSEVPPPMLHQTLQSRGNLNPIAESAPPKSPIQMPSLRAENSSTFLSTSSAAPLHEHNAPLMPPSPRVNAPSSVATSQSSAPSSMAVAGKSQSARVSDPDTWPRPPSLGNAAKPVNIMPPVPALRAEPVDDYDDDDEADEPEEPVEIVSAVAAPTAVTAIPVPASTAMQYTVKRPSKQATNTDMSWVNLNASVNR